MHQLLHKSSKESRAFKRFFSILFCFKKTILSFQFCIQQTLSHFHYCVNLPPFLVFLLSSFNIAVAVPLFRKISSLITKKVFSSINVSISIFWREFFQRFSYQIMLLLLLNTRDDSDFKEEYQITVIVKN